MSNSREKTIWVILVLISIVSIAAAGFKLFPINNHWKQARTRAENVQFGADKQLEGVIDFLEERLKGRNSFQFAIEKEPLRLTNVLYLTDAQGRMLRYRDKNKLRVTYVIDGINNRYAGIQYMGENFTVVVGDSVAGGEVVWINADEVVIVKGNDEYHFFVTGLIQEEEVTLKNNSRDEY